MRSGQWIPIPRPISSQRWCSSGRPYASRGYQVRGVDDHFVGIDDMVGIGKRGQRPVKTVMMSRYACYLVIQNTDPAKEIVALGQT